MEKRIVDRILELKSLCRFEEEIGGECGLTSPEIRCVGALGPGEQVSAGDLAGRLSLSPSRAEPGDHERPSERAPCRKARPAGPAGRLHLPDPHGGRDAEAHR